MNGHLRPGREGAASGGAGAPPPGVCTPSGVSSEVGQLLAGYQAQLAELTAKVGRLEVQLQQYAQPNGGAGPLPAAAAQLQAAAAAVEAEPPADVPMAASRVVMHEIVLPHMVDAMSICFGGQASIAARFWQHHSR